MATPSTPFKAVAHKATLSVKANATHAPSIRSGAQGLPKPYLASTACAGADAANSTKRAASAAFGLAASGAIGYSTGVAVGTVNATFTLSGISAASVAYTKAASTSARAT